MNLPEGLPSRPKGTDFRKPCSTLSGTVLTIGVSTNPGKMAFTLK